MTYIHFDPYHLQPLASLNQRRISALPGVEFEIIGKTGYEAASKPAFIRLIQAQAQALGSQGMIRRLIRSVSTICSSHSMVICV